MDFFLIVLTIVLPISVLAFLAYKTQKEQRLTLQALWETFQTPDSLVYPNLRIVYRNFQPPFFTNKREAFSYYRFSRCQLVANAHEMLLVGLGGWSYNKPMVPVLFVKAHVSPHIPVGTQILVCTKVTAKGNNIEIEFMDRMRVPKPIILTLKNVDEPLRNHLMEVFS